MAKNESFEIMGGILNLCFYLGLFPSVLIKIWFLSSGKEFEYKVYSILSQRNHSVYYMYNLIGQNFLVLL